MKDIRITRSSNAERFERLKKIGDFSTTGKPDPVKQRRAPQVSAKENYFDQHLIDRQNQLSWLQIIFLICHKIFIHVHM